MATYKKDTRKIGDVMKVKETANWYAGLIVTRVGLEEFKPNNMRYTFSIVRLPDGSKVRMGEDVLEATEEKVEAITVHKAINLRAARSVSFYEKGMEKVKMFGKDLWVKKALERYGCVV